MEYTLNELQNLPNLGDSHFDNLKIETKNSRVWLSRCTVDDGEPYNNKVTVERLVNGNWKIIQTYQAK